MQNIIKLFQIFFGLLITSVLSVVTATDPTIPSDPPFIASDFQKNAGNSINNLNSQIDNFLKKQEIIDLNYGLHVVNFINDSQEVALQNPEQQFIKDFARMACYAPYEANLPECNTTNDKNSQKTYGFLRPSNIFDISHEQPEEKALAAFAAKTMIDPLPNPKLNDILQNEDLNDSTKQKNIANLIAAQGPITLAKNSLNEIIAKRTKFANTESLIQMIQTESTRRLNSGWIESVQDLPMKHLILELLQIEAFKLWMDYNKFLQNERLEALIATLLSSQSINMNKMITQLEQSLNEAKNSASEAKSQLDEQSNNTQNNNSSGNNDNSDEILQKMGIKK